MGYLISVLVSAHAVFGFSMCIVGVAVCVVLATFVVDFIGGKSGDRQITLLKKFLLPLFGASALGFILTPGSIIFVKAVAP